MRRYGTGIRVVVAAVGVGGIASSFAVAGTIRDDVNDSVYVQLGADPKYQAEGRIDFNIGAGAFLGSGTLISSTWVLTAAHVVDNASISNLRFTVGDNVYTAAAWFPYDGWSGNLKDGTDIGLIRLSSPVTGVIPAARYTGTSEIGMVGTSVGYGRTGTGLTGDTTGAGMRRAGENVLDANGSALGSGYSSNLVVYDFDNPGATANRSWSSSGTPLAREYMIAGGDSGGGLFVDVPAATGPATRLAGVHSFVHAIDGTTNSNYGDAAGSTRVSVYNQWIDGAITTSWTKTGAGSYGDPLAWESGAVPGANDVVGFDASNGTTTVTMTGNTTNDRLLARGGVVTVDMGGSTYGLTSPSAEGSLVVAKYAGEVANVTFKSGTVSTRGAILGELAGTIGRVTLGDGGHWDAAGTVYVGGSEVGRGGTASITINAGGSLTVAGTLHVWHQGDVRVNGGALSGGNVELTGGGKLTVLSPDAAPIQMTGLSIDLAGGSQFNLAEGQVMLDYSGTSPADTVRQYLLAGRNGGAWNGAGIRLAAADPRYGIGWAEATSFAGDPQSPAAFPDLSAIYLTWTRNGDADLNGVVNLDDYALIDRGFHKGLTGWVNGDFNYDNVINGDDYLLIDLSFVIANAGFSPGMMAAREAEFGDDYVARLLASVPEPAGGVLLVACGLLGRTRKRRHSP